MKQISFLNLSLSYLLFITIHDKQKQTNTKIDVRVDAQPAVGDDGGVPRRATGDGTRFHFLRVLQIHEKPREPRREVLLPGTGVWVRWDQLIFAFFFLVSMARGRGGGKGNAKGRGPRYFCCCCFCCCCYRCRQTREMRGKKQDQKSVSATATTMTTTTKNDNNYYLYYHYLLQRILPFRALINISIMDQLEKRDGSEKRRRRQQQYRREGGRGDAAEVVFSSFFSFSLFVFVVDLF